MALSSTGSLNLLGLLGVALIACVDAISLGVLYPIALQLHTYTRSAMMHGIMIKLSERPLYQTLRQMAYLLPVCISRSDFIVRNVAIGCRFVRLLERGTLNSIDRRRQ